MEWGITNPSLFGTSFSSILSQYQLIQSPTEELYSKLNMGSQIHVMPCQTFSIPKKMRYKFFRLIHFSTPLVQSSCYWFVITAVQIHLRQVPMAQSFGCPKTIFSLRIGHSQADPLSCFHLKQSRTSLSLTWLDIGARLVVKMLCSRKSCHLLAWVSLPSFEPPQYQSYDSIISNRRRGREDHSHFSLRI